MTFTPQFYQNARISAGKKKVTVKSAERNLTLTLDKPVKTFFRKEGENTVVYVTLLDKVTREASAELSGTLAVDGTRHHEAVDIALDLKHPGSRFLGFGGNFRLQNPGKDPQVIDYCLDNMRVAFGRVEFPWSSWQPREDQDPVPATREDLNSRVRQSIDMAARLKGMGMPVVLSTWFPPQWALAPGARRGSGGVAGLKLDPAKKEAIYNSMVSYIKYIKEEFGVEVDYFSFNESDIGIDVLHSPQEHADFIREFGAVLAREHLTTKMLLGDNSDATTIDFIQPALKDESTHKYIGAVSFHSWRGCDDETLKAWAAAARSINVPLLIGEGSTDAAAHRYSEVFGESTFALYEINLYTRICALCQPLSILQWQLTSDYSLLLGDGIFGTTGPMHQTQRFRNLQQLASTPAGVFSVPVTSSRTDVNTAAFADKIKGTAAVHIVNNGASKEAHITGLPATATQAIVRVTSSALNSVAQAVPVNDGSAVVQMPSESFVTLIIE